MSRDDVDDDNDVNDDNDGDASEDGVDEEAEAAIMLPK